MAMLAEPRRKQKFSVDPRNLNWSNDESKFGQKMLEKMGWSKGKGLGATEQGEVDHIKINVKNDARGVGCTAKYGDTWLAHQDDFNSLLANLNAEHSAPNSGTSTPDGVTSLERSSKSSKARVHYGKFTRGKDLSTRGADELECIFGKKKKKTADENPEVQEASASPPDEPENTEDAPESEVKHFTSTQSVADYFAQKMAALQRLRNGTDSSASSPAPGETCSPEPDKSRNSPEDSENDKRDCVSESVNESGQSEEKTKKKKRKKTKEVVEDDIVKNEEESGSGSQETKKKRKKRKLVEEDTHDVQENEESPTEPPAKKKKKKCKKTHRTDPEMDFDDVIVQSRKKKKRSEQGQESDVQKLDDNESSDKNPVISEKKSKKKTKTESTDDKNSRTNEENSSSKNTAEKSKKKKKKNKIGMKERIRKQKMMNSQSESSKRYVIDKKSGKKIFIDDLELEKKFKGSNVSEVGPYGRAK